MVKKRKVIKKKRPRVVMKKPSLDPATKATIPPDPSGNRQFAGPLPKQDKTHILNVARAAQRGPKPSGFAAAMIPKTDVDYDNVPRTKNSHLMLLSDRVVYSGIIDSLEKGHYPAVACMSAGVPYPTFKRWMQEGQDGKNKLLVKFWKDVCIAMAAAESAASDCLFDAAKHDWKASVAYLERRFPERWSRGTQNRITVEGDVSVTNKEQVAAVVLTDIEARGLLRKAISRTFPGKLDDEGAIDADYEEVQTED